MGIKNCQCKLSDMNDYCGRRYQKTDAKKAWEMDFHQTQIFSDHDYYNEFFFKMNIAEPREMFCTTQLYKYLLFL